MCPGEPPAVATSGRSITDTQRPRDATVKNALSATETHYEISTDQQMPIVRFSPNSQVTSDIANGAISIQADDHHGQLLVHYLITPAAGDGKFAANLNASHAQYTLLAPEANPCGQWHHRAGLWSLL